MISPGAAAVVVGRFGERDVAVEMIDDDSDRSGDQDDMARDSTDTSPPDPGSFDRWLVLPPLAIVSRDDTALGLLVLL